MNLDDKVQVNVADSVFHNCTGIIKAIEQDKETMYNIEITAMGQHSNVMQTIMTRPIDSRRYWFSESELVLMP